MSSDRPPIEWKGAGRDTAFAVIDGHIYAILYWSDGFAGHAAGDDLEGPLSDQDAGWYLVFADDPQPQVGIHDATFQPVVQGMSEDDFRVVAEPVMQVASAVIRKRRGEAD